MANELRRLYHFFTKSFTEGIRIKFIYRYLATGCSMTDLHYSYRIGISTISVIIQEVCKTVWNSMKDRCADEPDKERWLQIAEGLLTNSNFLNCIGAIDGKHVRVIKPQRTGSLYYNYKNYFSVQLLAICVSNYCFTYVSIYNNSLFNKNLRVIIMNIPELASQIFTLINK